MTSPSSYSGGGGGGGGIPPSIYVPSHGLPQSNYEVSKLNRKGMTQVRILMIDYEEKKLKNIRKGKVQKEFTFSEIIGYERDVCSPTRFYLRFKNRSYELHSRHDVDREEILQQIQNIIEDETMFKAYIMRKHDASQFNILKEGVALKRGKVHWAKRRLVLLRGILSVYRGNSDKPLVEDYPLNVITLLQTWIFKKPGAVLQVTTKLRSFFFRFSSDVERNTWHEAMIATACSPGDDNVLLRAFGGVSIPDANGDASSTMDENVEVSAVSVNGTSETAWNDEDNEEDSDLFMRQVHMVVYKDSEIAEPSNIVDHSRGYRGVSLMDPLIPTLETSSSGTISAQHPSIDHLECKLRAQSLGPPLRRDTIIGNSTSYQGDDSVESALNILPATEVEEWLDQLVDAEEPSYTSKESYQQQFLEVDDVFGPPAPKLKRRRRKEALARLKAAVPHSRSHKSVVITSSASSTTDNAYSRHSVLTKGGRHRSVGLNASVNPLLERLMTAVAPPRTAPATNVSRLDIMHIQPGAYVSSDIEEDNSDDNSDVVQLNTVLAMSTDAVASFNECSFERLHEICRPKYIS